MRENKTAHNPHTIREILKNLSLNLQRINERNMKKILILIVSFYAVLMWSSSILANSHISCMLNYGTEVNNDLDTVDYTETSRGRRIPARPVQCNISVENGVSFIGFNYEISTFEIYDCYGSCIASFNEERDFVETLINLTGDLELRFHTDGHLLRGFVTL